METRFIAKTMCIINTLFLCFFFKYFSVMRFYRIKKNYNWKATFIKKKSKNKHIIFYSGPDKQTSITIKRCVGKQFNSREHSGSMATAHAGKNKPQNPPSHLACTLEAAKKVPSLVVRPLRP